MCRAAHRRSPTLAVLAAASVLVSPQHKAESAPTGPVLARLDLAGPPSELGLPVHAVLRDKAGCEYALVIAEPDRLARTGRPWLLLDTDATPGRYLAARPMRRDARAAASGQFDLLQDDGRQWLVRVRAPDDAERLSALGFELGRLSPRPIVWPAPPSTLALAAADPPFVSNAWVAAMMANVTSNFLTSLVSQWSGEEPLPAERELRMIATRKTTSGSPSRKANAFAYDFMQALGLNPSYHAWSQDGYVNSNVVGTQVGATASNEIALITAHLDSISSTERAPGADDNASGSAAVLAAASVMSQCRFERTVRYVLFTGEEQGPCGSDVYAQSVRDAGQDIRAALNLDMIAWDSLGDPTLRLYTHSTGHSAYSNDLAIARVFTNVVATYGLRTRLTPLITPDSSAIWSDHASFWTYGFTAILAIEDDWDDFNDTYYHTAGDTLAHMNVPYFTAFARAAVGTIAHLARPVEPRDFDAVRVIYGDWTATNRSFGANVFHAVHRAGSQEGTDALDVRSVALSPATNAAWLSLATRPGADDLALDSRATNSETVFHGHLSAGSRGAAVGPCTNRLRFVQLTPPATNRVYTLRVTQDGQYASPPGDFLRVTNLSDLCAAGGFLNMPVLVNAPSGVVYGACDIGTRFLSRDPARVGPRIESLTSTQILLSADGQIGTRIVDQVDVRSNLTAGASWIPLASFTSDVPPVASDFDSGWTSLSRRVSLGTRTNSPALFFRIRRAWLSP